MAPKPNDAELTQALVDLLDEVKQTVDGRYPPCELAHIGYRLFVEEPAREGIDAAYRALWAEAES